MNSLFSLARSYGGLLVVVLVPCVAHGADIFERVQGQWGWLDDKAMSCAAHPHVITFVDANARARFEMKAPSIKSVAGGYFYQVLSHDKKSITMRLESETGRSKNGELVTWILMLKDSDTYAWRRDDWPAGKTTGKIVRCDRANI